MSSLSSRPPPESNDEKDASSFEKSAIGSSPRIAISSSGAWLKMDCFIVPLCTMMFFLSFLDRTNVSNARLAGLQQELNITSTQYSLALTVTYIPYILVEIPSNLLYKSIGPHIMLPTMLALWGLVCTLQGLVHSYSGLLACRFFVGLFEGGLLPGISLYLVSFYPRGMLQYRYSLFFAASGLAGAFSGLLAAAIVKMEGVGGKHGWSWIFILEGAFTFLFGLSCFAFMPRTPAHAVFLTDLEKEIVLTALKEDGIMAADERDDEFSWVEVFRTFKQPHMLPLAVMGFFNGATLYGLAYFLPSIVASLGYTTNRAQLMSVPPFAASFVLSVLSGLLGDRYRHRGLSIIIFAIVSTAGFATFLGSGNNSVRYGALFLLVPGTYCIGPPLATWTANNVAPHIRRATALAILITMTNSGGILATWLLGTLSPAPKYTKASITFLIFQVGVLFAALVTLLYVNEQNKRKAKLRSAGLCQEAEPKAIMGNDSVWYHYVL
ncbi:MFS general substrate transporter [Obba rivulosa]|uniref:MFS general substrate transporter n=1 Tax=Obba rivulosa TaxID=1052685 RepID=A0A8E2DGN1_9APHY|nr:MFS general substrate transporter [Obba rivulosa]